MGSLKITVQKADGGKPTVAYFPRWLEAATFIQLHLAVGATVEVAPQPLSTRRVERAT